MVVDGDTEESDETNNAKAKPLNKFKITARMVTRNMALTKGLAQDAEKHLKMYTVPSADGKASEMTFNFLSRVPVVQRSVGKSENDPNEGSVVANGGRVGDRAAVRDEIGLFQSLLPLRPP